MDRRERIEDLNTAMLVGQDGLQAKMWTALPVIVDSYDATKQTCSVRSAIQAQMRNEDGSTQWVSLPLLVDVPVVFPSGGGFTMTFPIVQGDEGIGIFSSRCIDAWWYYGGIQTQYELRMHDLSDCFIIVGPKSQPRKLAGVSTNSVQLRSDAGTQYIELAAAGVINIVAPGGLNIVGNVNVTGTVDATGEGTFNGTHTVSAHTHGGVEPGGGSTSTPSG